MHERSDSSHTLARTKRRRDEVLTLSLKLSHDLINTEVHLTVGVTEVAQLTDVLDPFIPGSDAAGAQNQAHH